MSMTGKRKRRQARPPKYFRYKRDALREARRRNKLRAALLVHKPVKTPPPINVWMFVGGYIGVGYHRGRGYYVGTELPTRITSSKAVITSVAIDGWAAIGGAG